jgi:iron complex transport system permease protein
LFKNFFPLPNRNDIFVLTIGLLVLVMLFAVNLYIGDVAISWGDIFSLLTGNTAGNESWPYIVESRLNRTVMAIGAGSVLALSGLILQVYFRNPLAGPDVLGISSGASLGVAAVILGGLSVGSFIGNLGIILSGICGAFVVLGLLLVVSRFIHNAVTLLVVGLMFGYFTSAIINILFLWADLADTREYVVWGLGSFEGVQNAEMSVFLIVGAVIIFVSFFLVRPLNALVLGPEYAASLGINLAGTRLLIIVITGVLAGLVTVYCGPVSFIGVAVPQLVRMLVRSKNHALMIPAALLFGAGLALLADIVVRMSGNQLPLNTVTALIGAPLIIYTIIKMNSRLA